MNLPNLKKAKAGLLATLAIGTMAVASGVAPVKIAGVSNVQEAKAYSSWEHPFYYLGANKYSQQDGDGICWNVWTNLPARSQYSLSLAGIYTKNFSEKLAWDGAFITNPRHVWYHRANGHCVANT
jgi:hypothetical protein